MTPFSHSPEAIGGRGKRSTPSNIMVFDIENEMRDRKQKGESSVRKKLPEC